MDESPLDLPEAVRQAPVGTTFCTVRRTDQGIVVDTDLSDEDAGTLMFSLGLAVIGGAARHVEETTP